MSAKTTIAELKNIMVKSQVPSVDYTVLQPGLIIGGMSVILNLSTVNDVNRIETNLLKIYSFKSIFCFTMHGLSVAWTFGVHEFLFLTISCYK